MPEVRPNEEAKAKQAHSRPRLSQFSRIYDRSGDKDQEFLDRLLDECTEGEMSVRQTAFALGAEAAGFKWIADPSDDSIIKLSPKLRQAYFALVHGPSWLRRFLESLLDSYEEQKLCSIDDVIRHAENELYQLNTRLDDAIEMLLDSPQLVADEIRAAAAKLDGGAK